MHKESTIVSVNETPTTTKKLKRKKQLKNNNLRTMIHGRVLRWVDLEDLRTESQSHANNCSKYSRISNTEVPLFNQIDKDMSLKSNSYNAGGLFGYNYQKEFSGWRRSGFRGK